MISHTSMSFRRRRVWVPLTVLFILLAIAGALYLRRQEAPEAARLLPESDAVVYFNLRPIRLATNFGEKPVSHEPEYEEFVRQTGFQFERDLDEAAIAVHPAETLPGSPLAPHERRYSDIFVGRFDSTKVTHYLHQLATAVERYKDTDVFLIPHEGRSVRVAILSVDTVAVSNTADATNIKGMIDRFHQIAAPFGGPSLLREHYRDVPFGSTGWAILRLSTPDGQAVTLPLPGGIAFALPKGTVTVASVRYVGSVQLKAEAFAPSEADAKQLAESAKTFLQLFHSIEINTQPSGPDPDVKALFDSFQVEQQSNRAILSAELPRGFLRKILSEAPAAMSAPPAPEPAPKKIPEKKPGKKK
ncbi:MAG: hypothetical protein JWN45_1737 [Acidobacteriaceae bacterium]|nr:hypothetical protein [Acidobacteriaceae bacterium]